MKPVGDPKDSVMWRLVNLQPAVWRGLVVAVIAIAGTFGFDAATDLPDNVMLVIIGLIPIIQAVWTKGAVTPNAKVAVVVPDPVGEPNVVAAGKAVVSAPAEFIAEAAGRKGGDA